MTTTQPADVSRDIRPAGQPGTVNREHRHSGWTYPAVKTDDGTVLYWRDTDTSAGRWLAAPPRLAASFEPGPDWQADCQHVESTPWRTCDTEADCLALQREDGAS